jgi:hypothetical protein
MKKISIITVLVCIIALMASPTFATFGGDAFGSGSSFEGNYGITTDGYELDAVTKKVKGQEVIVSGAEAVGTGQATGKFSGMQGLGAGISAGFLTVTAIETPTTAHASGIVANGAVGFITPHTEVVRILCWNFPYQTNKQKLQGSGSLNTVAVKAGGVASTYGDFHYSAHNSGGLIAAGGITGGMSNVTGSNGGHTTTVIAVSGTGAGAISIPTGNSNYDN